MNLSPDELMLIFLFFDLLGAIFNFFLFYLRYPLPAVFIAFGLSYPGYLLCTVFAFNRNDREISQGMWYVILWIMCQSPAISGFALVYQLTKNWKYVFLYVPTVWVSIGCMIPIIVMFDNPTFALPVCLLGLLTFAGIMVDFFLRRSEKKLPDYHEPEYATPPPDSVSLPPYDESVISV